jgi:regulator of cell morphogenesis and NO signaling
MTATLSSLTTVATIATELPGAAGLFERLGIDYCCGGKMPLETACRRKGLQTQDVLAQLESITPDSGQSTRDWSSATMTELAEHIQSTHHQYLKDELPRLITLTAKVARVHGENHPELITLADAFVRFSDDMFSHMDKEEKVLFPLLRATERAGAAPSVSVDQPIQCMTGEHEEAGRALESFRTLTNDFAPPTGACNSWRVMLSDLERLERDMHQHVHKENNILFVKAVAPGQPV